MIIEINEGFVEIKSSNLHLSAREIENNELAEEIDKKIEKV